MTNMTAYEMLSGFINYFMYNATDFTKEDVASALSKLSSEFNDNTVPALEKENAMLKASLNKKNKKWGKLVKAIRRINELSVERKKKVSELKKLLKECQTQIDVLLDTCISFDEAMCFEQGCKWSEELFRKENKDVYELLTKINEVLR